MGVFELLDEHYKMQQGGKATRQDSLNVYNNSRQVENYYRKRGYKSRDGISQTYRTATEANDASYKDFKGNHSKLRIDIENGTLGQKMFGLDNEDYRQNIDKNKYKQRERSFNKLDMGAPMQLFDKRIEPTETKTIGKTGDLVQLHTYNTIANKPFDLLTEKEKAERVQKYGRQGVPDSYNSITGKVKKPTNTQKVSETGLQTMKDFMLQAPREKLTFLQTLSPQGIIQNNQEISASLPTLSPQAQIPKSFDIEYSAQRMNGGTGYYDQNNVQSVDLETALRAQEQADRMNKLWQEKYGNSQNPKAKERLEQLKDSVKITPNYQQGGEYSENEKKFLEEVARLKLI
jgi:hypothetical protein